MQSSDSQEIIETDTYKMQLEVETGVEFDFFSASTELQYGYE